MSGPDLNPCTATSVPQLLPPSDGTRDALTPVTPGWAASSLFEPLEELLRSLGGVAVQLRRDAERGELLGR